MNTLNIFSVGEIMKGAKYFFVATLLTFLCVDMSGAVDMCIQSWANNNITGYGRDSTTSGSYTIKKVRWSAKMAAQGTSSRDNMYGIGKCFRNYASASASVGGISTQPPLYTAVDASSPYITQFRGSGNATAQINACWCKMYSPAVSKWVYVGVINGTSSNNNCFATCGDRCAPSGTMATALKNAYWSSVSY